MIERDVHTLQAEALVTLAEATRAANGARDVESALGHLRQRRGKPSGTRRRTSVRVGSRLVSVSSRFQAYSSSRRIASTIS
jgi:hypothetical protein